jgi:hypothetical protein
VLGNSTSDLHGQLKSIGFKRIEHSNAAMIDLQDLLSLARSLELKQFCVFYANTEILDGFVDGLEEVAKIMNAANSQFGLIPTVVLSQGGKKFSPVVIGKGGGAVPLNGLVIDLNLEQSDFVGLSKRVPILRIREISELLQVSNFHDTYAFLHGVEKRDRSHVGIRESIRNEFIDRNLQGQRDPIEEIRHMPRARRRALGYSLMSSLPFVRPLVFVAKWFLRRKS